MPLDQNAAEVLGLQAVAWLVSNEDLLPVFLGSTGASEDDLRAQVSDPAFLGSIFDFLLMDDAWVTRFCDEIGISYDMPMRARAGLPGGEQVHWT
ncbi:MAG: DUF3572 domain-containing protein [Pseudomonadota bacterium]